MFSFRDANVENIKDDERVKYAAKKVMDFIGAAVALLYDMPALATLLKPCGVRHLEYKTEDWHYKVRNQGPRSAF